MNTVIRKYVLIVVILSLVRLLWFVLFSVYMCVAVVVYRCLVDIAAAAAVCIAVRCLLWAVNAFRPTFRVTAVSHLLVQVVRPRCCRAFGP